MRRGAAWLAGALGQQPWKALEGLELSSPDEG